MVRSVAAIVRPLVGADLPEFAGLRRLALADSPLAFAADGETDVALDLEFLRARIADSPDWVIFGAFTGQLSGCVGLMRDRHAKASHKVHLWGMYVEPAHRRSGIGTQLLDAAIAHARSIAGVSWLHLGVSSAAPAAQRLYERAGFRVWGVEPDALRHDGVSAEDVRMSLRL